MKSDEEERDEEKEIGRKRWIVMQSDEGEKREE